MIFISAIGMIGTSQAKPSEKPLVGPTYVGGWLNSTTTWTLANSPYIVTNDLSIGDAGTVYIEPGVEVRVNNNGWIKVYGHIYANGTSGNRIWFRVNNTFEWVALYIYSSDNSFIHCNFTDFNDGIQLMGNVVNIIQNNIFNYCNITGPYFTAFKMNYAYNNKIGNTTIFWIGEAGDGVVLTSSNYNEFYKLDINYTYGAMVYLDNSSYNKFLNGWWNFTDDGNGLTLVANSNHNYFYNINISDAGYFSTYYQVETIFSNGNSFVNCSLYSPTSYGLKVDNSKSIYLNDSSIVSSSSYHIDLYNGAELTLLNTIFDNNSVRHYDNSSTFLVQNYLTVEVLDIYDSSPVPNANVIVRNVTSAVIGNVFSGPNGVTPPIPCSYYKNQDLSGNSLIEPWEQTFYNPYNVSVTHPFYYDGFSEPDPWVDQNMFIQVKLEEQNIDSVIIRDGSGNTGEWVGNRFYFLNDIVELYTACYNDTLGYIGDLSSSWQSSNASVATVTTPGPSTMFEGIANGTMNITVNHRSVTNQTGQLFVVMWNTAPNLTALPNQNLDEDQSLDNAIDLWGYADDNETAVANLAFSIDNVTEPDCGVTVDSNRYIDINPTPNWHGISNVTVEVWDGFDYDALNSSTFQVTVNPVNDLPELTNPSVTPTIGEVDTPFEYYVIYSDLENEAPSYIRVSIDGLNHVMTPVNASDLDFTDGNEYIYTTNLAPGTAHTYQFFTSDGTAANSTVLYNNPTVNVPKFPDLIPLDIIFSEQSQVIPNNTALTITVTIENKGLADASNVNVSIELKSRTRAFETWTALGADEILAFIAVNSTENITFNWTAGPPGNYTLRVSLDTMDLIVEENETNNQAERDIDIGPTAGELHNIEVTPSSWTMNEGDTKQFTAKGYDFYGDEVPVTVAWSVNGGGTIDATGTFKAELWGDWEIYANYSGMSVIATVLVKQKAVELSKIDVIPSKWIMVINDTMQFIAQAYDINDTEVAINPEWVLEIGGGTINKRNGMFTALEAGKWVVNAKYAAINGEIIGSAIVNVLKSPDDNVTETFEDENSNVEITATLSGSGTINISKIDDPELDIPEDLNDIGIFIDITKSETLELICAMIKIPFDSLNLPDGVDPATLQIFYWDEDSNEWVLIEDSWVEGNYIFANVTHLTIFAPMAESAEKEAGSEDEDNTLLYVVVAIIIVIIIVIVIGILLRKRRPSEKEKLEAEAEAEAEEEEEAEDAEIDLDELKTKYKKCRKCGEKLEVPVSETEKVSIKCDECGARARIPNPYMAQIEELKEAAARVKSIEDGELEDMDDWDTDTDEPEAADELEWAEDDAEEPDTEVEPEPEDEFEDWDKAEEEIDEVEQKAVEEFEDEQQPEELEEELPDWDEKVSSKDDDDEFEDWD